jgi:hypothetical protein
MLEKVWDRTVQAEKDSDPEKKGCAVIIAVEKITNYPGVVQQEK